MKRPASASISVRNGLGRRPLTGPANPSRESGACSIASPGSCGIVIGVTSGGIPFRSSLLALILLLNRIAAALPPGFVSDQIGGVFECVVGATPMGDGRVLAWERSGKLWVIDGSGTRASSPLLDISDEVQGSGDQGLLGLALHPKFPSTPHVYVLYVVDRHHLLYAGTPDYNPNSNLYWKATIGRLTRYSIEFTSGSPKIVSGSRKVILGKAANDGIPILHKSHSVGNMVFGTDGTLLVSTGDNADFTIVDSGGAALNPNVTQALSDGIIQPCEDVGAFRSQVIDSLCGKILRLDPDTGHGIPSNPWFDAAKPAAPASRVWALGLRNPYRMSIVKGTGSHDPLEGQPGTLLVGNVGSGQAGSEQVFVVKRGGLNMGWPLFEGLSPCAEYWQLRKLDVSRTRPDGSPIPFNDKIVAASPEPEACIDSTLITQAEDSSAPTDGGAEVRTNWPGYSGTGFRLLWSRRWVDFSLDQPVTGPAVFAVRYSYAGSTDLPVGVMLDGVEWPGARVVKPTGNERAWRVLRVPLQTLKQGSHALRITNGTSSNPLNIDAAWLEHPDANFGFAPSVPTFLHHQPLICWRSEARTPGFDIFGAPSGFLVGGAGGASGQNFSGTCVVGGPWIDFPSWPEAYHGAYFGDYSAGWIRWARADLASQCGSKSGVCKCVGTVQSVDVFDTNTPAMVGLFADPVSESLYSAQWTKLMRHRWLPGGSLPPVIHLQASPLHGPTPLSVRLDASSSSDPEGQALSFVWSFSDGSPPSSGPVLERTFTNPQGTPKSVGITLEVSDAAGAKSTRSILIGLDNSPPVVQIASPTDGALYSTRVDSVLPLIPEVQDAEHDVDSLDFAWQTVLHHDTHTHPEPVDTQQISQTTLQATRCSDSAVYWYEITLTVRDPTGLGGSRTIRLDPDCSGRIGCEGDLDFDGKVDIADLSVMLLLLGSTDSAGDIDRNGEVDNADLAEVLIRWGECPPAE